MQTAQSEIRGVLLERLSEIARLISEAVECMQRGDHWAAAQRVRAVCSKVNAENIESIEELLRSPSQLDLVGMGLMALASERGEIPPDVERELDEAANALAAQETEPKRRVKVGFASERSNNRETYNPNGYL